MPPPVSRRSIRDILVASQDDIEEVPPVLMLSVQGGHYIHKNTKNVDFLKMHEILKSKGVKRNDFFLRTYDKDLLDVDPHDPKLSKKMQEKVLLECRNNFWYFARECVRFRAPGGYIPCQLNLGNLAFYFLKLMCVDVAIEMPRQFGKTGAELIIIIWASFFILKNTEIGMANKSEDNNSKDLGDLKTIVRALPQCLKIYDPDNLRTGSNNTKSITINYRTVNIRTFLSSANSAKANAKARGFSIPFANIDEACFVDNFKVFYLGFRPAMNKQVELAKRLRTIYGCTLSSTSGTTLDPDQRFYKESILDTAARFNINLFEYTSRHQLKEYMKRNAAEDILGGAPSSFVYIRYDYNALGRGIEYLKECISDLKGDEDAINKDVKLRWVDYSKSSPYRREFIERLQDYIKTPLHTVMLDDFYPLDFYQYVTDWDFPYMVSVDVSAGKGGSGDSSAIIIQDPRTLETIAKYKSNTISLPQLTFLVKEIATKLFVGACIAVEVNGVGNHIVQELAMDKQIVPRLYHEQYDHGLKKPKKWQDLAPHQFGFLSTNNAKGTGKTSTMYKTIVADALEHDYETLRDIDLIEQIGNLEKDAKTGKIKTAHGKHKDVVSSWVIGRWALLYGKTITNWIPTSYIRKIKLESGTIVEGNNTYTKGDEGAAARQIVSILPSSNRTEHLSGGAFEGMFAKKKPSGFFGKQNENGERRLDVKGMFNFKKRIR